MNEQFQKLYEQSFVTDSYVNVGPDGTKLGIKFDPEEFAELIVRECGVALSPMLRDMVSRGQAFDLIKQHFGVEE